jgi:hypothetical protein
MPNVRRVVYISNTLAQQLLQKSVQGAAKLLLNQPHQGATCAWALLCLLPAQQSPLPTTPLANHTPQAAVMRRPKASRHWLPILLQRLGCAKGYSPVAAQHPKSHVPAVSQPTTSTLETYPNAHRHSGWAYTQAKARKPSQIIPAPPAPPPPQSPDTRSHGMYNTTQRQSHPTANPAAAATTACTVM